MGGGDSGNKTTTVRFAPYIEEHHQSFLNIVAAERDTVLHDSPFTGYVPIDVDSGFFGVGYILSSFPSLYDMYGKFMAGLDIEVLFGQILEDSVNATAIDNLVSAHAAELSDDIEQVADPRFTTGMRDMNAVMSSSFVIGRAIMETQRTKAISKFSAEARYKMIMVAADRFKTHLDWNKNVVHIYAEIMKLYIAGKMDMDNHSMEILAKHKLWPFTVLSHNRSAIGALTGAQDVSEDVKGASKTQKAIGGALSGAAAGYMAGGYVGAIVGGVIGLAGGLMS